MATDLRALSKARRCERSARPIDQGVRATNSVHATMSSSNSNLNTVYGSVQTVINSNPTYLLNGEIPEESSAIQIKILNTLKAHHVPQAVFNAQLGSGCMEGTRVEILRDVEMWVKDPNAPKIFWLTGWAGTGKSAIAWTVCLRASKSPDMVLGGSFFCSRSASWAAQRDIRCVIPTLAQLLARQSTTFSQALADELARDPDVLHKQVAVQLEQLLSKPLRSLGRTPVPVLFVIDALDECGGQSPSSETLGDAETHRIVSEMLDALVALCHAEPDLPVKFLVTSRPETHIRDTPVSDVEFSKVLCLHTVSDEQVAADIRLYIAAKLLNQRLRGRFTDDDVRKLSDLCGGLFIIAATALKYAFERGNDSAVARFKTLLNTSQDGLSSKAAAPLDHMYALILEDAARVEETEVDVDRLPALFRFLSALLSARMILSVTAMADLLNLSADDLRAIISRLHAIIHVPEDDHVPGLRTLHASFGEYFFRRAPSQLCVSEVLVHETPARACLSVMADHLHFNVSQSSSSYEPNASTRPDCITLSLEYACTQWIYHIASLQESSVLDMVVDNNFRPKFLFWLEVMSVLGQVQRAIAMLMFATTTVKSYELSRFFRDANRFVTSSREAIEKSAPHIYLSALPLADKNASIYKTFIPLYTGLISVDVFGIDQHGGPLLMTFTGHAQDVTSVAYGPDGLLLASGSYDGTVRIWDTCAGGETMLPLAGGDGAVLSVAFAPSGELVASGTTRGSVCIWNIAGDHPTEPKRLLGHSASVTSVAFSSNGSLVAALSRDKNVRVWSVATGAQLAALKFSEPPQSIPVFALDGRRRSRNVPDPIRDSDNEISFSSDGQVILSGPHDWRIQDLHTEGLEFNTRFRFSPVGQMMVSTQSRSIYLWTQPDGQKWSSLCLSGHTSMVNTAVFSPNGAHIASASADGTVRIWDTRGRRAAVQHQKTISGQERRHGISSSEANIVYVHEDGSTRIWNAKTGERVLPPRAGHTFETSALAISSDGLLVASGCVDGTVCVSSSRTGEAVGELLHNYPNDVTVVAFSPNARWLAAGSSYNTIRIWDMATEQARHHGPLFCGSAIQVLVFSSDSRLVAAGCSNNWIQLWQIQPDLKALLPLNSHFWAVRSIGFSPDGAHIALGGPDGSCNVWNIQTRQAVLSLTGHHGSGSVRAVDYSPDGNFVATASDDCTVCLWNAHTGANAAVFYGHQKAVALLGFTSDGASLVSRSDDGTIIVWDANTASFTFSQSAEIDSNTLSVASLREGWLRGPSGELLLWVPAEYNSYLHRSRYMRRVDGQCVVVRTTSDGWNRGFTWSMCYRGGISGLESNTT